jgi:hypothetical protein
VARTKLLRYCRTMHRRCLSVIGQAISRRTCTGLSHAAYLGLSYPPERAITGPILLDAANRADYLHERCSILPKRACCNVADGFWLLFEFRGRVRIRPALAAARRSLLTGGLQS